MKHNADTIVSLYISCSMSELLEDTTAMAGMTPKQRALLDTVCRTAAEDALAMCATDSTAPENRPGGISADLTLPVICIA